MNQKKIVEIISTCPTRPNCVSSMGDKKHFLKPIAMTLDIKSSISKIKLAISKFPRTKLVSESENHLQLEFTSKIFRFTDDVWFYFDENEKLIHFNSASRVGYSDRGVNRKRIQEIRSFFNNPESNTVK